MFSLQTPGHPRRLSRGTNLPESVSSHSPAKHGRPWGLLGQRTGYLVGRAGAAPEGPGLEPAPPGPLPRAPGRPGMGLTHWEQGGRWWDDELEIRPPNLLWVPNCRADPPGSLPLPVRVEVGVKCSREAPQRPSGAGGGGQGMGEHLRSGLLESTWSPWLEGDPRGEAQPHRGGHRWGVLSRGEASPACPRAPWVQPELEGSPEGSLLGEDVVSWRMSRGCRLGWDRVNVLLINVPARPGSLEATRALEAARRVRVAGTFEPFPGWYHLGASFSFGCKPHSWLQNSGSEQQTGERRRGRESGPAGGFLGPVVLFAVGFIAQNTVDLVDNGRRQLGEDLCVTTGAIRGPHPPTLSPPTLCHRSGDDRPRGPPDPLSALPHPHARFARRPFPLASDHPGRAPPAPPPPAVTSQHLPLPPLLCPPPPSSLHSGQTHVRPRPSVLGTTQPPSSPRSSKGRSVLRGPLPVPGLLPTLDLPSVVQLSGTFFPPSVCMVHASPSSLCLRVTFSPRPPAPRSPFTLAPLCPAGHPDLAPLSSHGASRTNAPIPSTLGLSLPCVPARRSALRGLAHGAGGPRTRPGVSQGLHKCVRGNAGPIRDSRPLLKGRGGGLAPSRDPCSPVLLQCSPSAGLRWTHPGARS